ncbi:chemotaxis protein [Streptacidiphilus sp. N1-12]|uniref:Chemotaxis protein n=2 Tax=Streptacidiphilus alkalitolerans TaxID=3342712 RepID=A0ABV6VIY3_9ACTN
MYPDLSAQILSELRRPRGYPAVSVLVPTHRREPENAQDPVRLRNLLAEAKDLVQADPAVSRADRIAVLDQLDQAASQIDPVDLAYAGDGLALFAAPGEHHVWSLGRAVPARVVLAETFVTRNLVAAQLADQPYWVLAVAADHASLWSGGPGRVVEQDTGGFPLTRDLEDPDAERKERIGDLPSTFRDEQTRQFLRDVDTAVTSVLRADQRPLYVLGEAAAVAVLEEVGTAAGRATAVVRHGGLAQGSAEAVREAVLPAVKEQAEKESASVRQELDQARGRRQFAAGIDEVWQQVTAGRVGLLAVEEPYLVTVRDDGDHLVPAEPGDRGARDDIVDEIIEKALDTGARVSFLPDGALAGTGHISAALRY